MTQQAVVKCYKTLKYQADGRITGAYDYGEYRLPRKSVGKWYPLVEHVALCESGYHACEREQLVYHLSDIICPAELRGGIVYDDNKIAGQQIRLYPALATWNEQTARLFAADCAEYALKWHVERYPNDERPGLAIRAVRQRAFGLIDHAAASLAAYAAHAAAYAAAAAGAAAATGAYAAARAARAAREWQTERLWQYLDGDVDLDAIKESVR